jgi:hypothetical protein
METTKKYSQYFSKWRGVWVYFKNEPTVGQVYELLKYNYLLR